MTDWAQRATAVAKDVVLPLALDTDRQARFPIEAITALRDACLLSLPIPIESGGPGGSLRDITRVLRILGGADASLGLILTMHYSQICVIARHGQTPELQEFLAEVHQEQLLIANSNSEKSIASTERRSLAALTPDVGGGYRLVKDTPVISYAEHADAFLITVKTTAEAAPNDQVLALARASQVSLEPLGGWDTLGLRATGSRPFHLEAKVAPGMVISDYRSVVDLTGLPLNNLMAAASCIGVAESGIAIARAFVRKHHRGDQRADELARHRLAQLLIKLDSLRGLWSSAIAAFELVDGQPDVASVAMIMQLQTLKVASTRLTCELTVEAMGLCGEQGYADEGPFALGRILRDAIGLTLMVGNDAILGQNGEWALIRKVL